MDSHKSERRGLSELEGNVSVDEVSAAWDMLEELEEKRLDTEDEDDDEEDGESEESDEEESELSESSSFDRDAVLVVAGVALSREAVAALAVALVAVEEAAAAAAFAGTVEACCGRGTIKIPALAEDRNSFSPSEAPSSSESDSEPPEELAELGDCFKEILGEAGNECAVKLPLESFVMSVVASEPCALPPSFDRLKLLEVFAGVVVGPGGTPAAAVV